MVEYVYQDKYLGITNEQVILYTYYFPCGSKTINISDIVKIEELGLHLCNMKTWGMNCSGNWFPLDCNRIRKSKAIVFHVNSCVKPSITPDNYSQVYEIICDLLKKKKLINS
jgi:hypothetical protein